jgi:ABC-2 type transport system permease protein
MKKILEVARWEYIERIRTKAFIISVIITPIIIILFSIIPSMVTSNSNESTKLVGIIDDNKIDLDELNLEVSYFKLKNGQPEYLLVNLNNNQVSPSENLFEADKRIKEGQIVGYFIVKKNLGDITNIEFRCGKIDNQNDIANFELIFNKLKLKETLRSQGLNPQLVDINSVKINSIQINKNIKNGADFISVFYKSIIYIILLTLLIIYSGQMLVRSLLEEKSNRLIEILVSSCKPEELLAGKIIGLSSLAITQMVLWFIIASMLLGSNVIPITSFNHIWEILIYFILGFLFYSSLLVGVGSIVSTEQEAQQITSYMSMVLIIPILIIIPAMQNPESLFIKILTYFPLTTPSIMILKINITNISFTEFLITVLLMVVSIWLTIKVSTKIFRVGILYYDKVPSLKELKSWLAHR